MAILKGEVDVEEHKVPDRYPIDRIPETYEPYKPTNKDHVHDHSTAGGSWLKILAITVIFAFVLFGVYKVCIKRCRKRRRLQRMSEQGTGEVRYQEFASYTS